MQVIFLGTSSMVPTKERNHSAVFVRHESKGILIDCGEGTQRQMKIAGISISDIDIILISHWHGDHVLGIPGVIQTLAGEGYSRTLKIYGPKGSKKKIKGFLDIFDNEKKIEMDIKEVSEGIIFDGSEIKIDTRELEHGVKCLGFSIIEKDRRRIKVDKVKKLGIPEGPLLGKLQKGENIKFKGKQVKFEDVTYIVKGKKISYIADTIPCENAVKLAENSDLMICEATYTSKLEEKAEEYKHMTAKQAASIAHQAEVKKLVLVHFSARYKDSKEVEEDAKDIFPDVVAGYDFMKVKL